MVFEKLQVEIRDSSDLEIPLTDANAAALVLEINTCRHRNNSPYPAAKPLDIPVEPGK